MKIFLVLFLLSVNSFASTYINCGSPSAKADITIQLNDNQKGNIIISTKKRKSFLTLQMNKIDSNRIEFKANKNTTKYSISFDKRHLEVSSEYFPSDLYVETKTRIHREQLNCFSKLFH